MSGVLAETTNIQQPDTVGIKNADPVDEAPLHYQQVLEDLGDDTFAQQKEHRATHLDFAVYRDAYLEADLQVEFLQELLHIDGLESLKKRAEDLDNIDEQLKKRLLEHKNLSEAQDALRTKLFSLGQQVESLVNTCKNEKTEALTREQHLFKSLEGEKPENPEDVATTLTNAAACEDRLTEQATELSQVQERKEKLQQELYEADCIRIPLQKEVDDLQSACNRLSSVNESTETKEAKPRLNDMFEWYQSVNKVLQGVFG